MPRFPYRFPMVSEAQSVARHFLTADPDRLTHVHSAARIAELSADALGLDDPEALIAAAWLHDIGYVEALARTGFHPLDGALYLADAGWPDRVVLLVAHHSHASVHARYYGVENQMEVLDRPPMDAEDVLTFADLTSGLTGMGATPRQRIAEMRVRHGAASPVPVRVREARYRLLLNAATRVTAALSGHSSRGTPRQRFQSTEARH